jgi:hypothetical protein
MDLIERPHERISTDCDEAEAEIARLRSALEAARIPHLRVEGDPWYSCPVAYREDYDDPLDPITTCQQCDGKPCNHGCNCGAEQHNARIDEALK